MNQHTHLTNPDSDHWEHMMGKLRSMSTDLLMSSPQYRCWYNSEECRSLRTWLPEECNSLIHLGESLLPQQPTLQSICLKNTDRIAYASRSTIHRGVYCPSPAYDLVVGKAYRGKIIKSAAGERKLSYKYHLDANDNLICAIKYSPNAQKIVATEYLLYGSASVYGISFDCRNRLSSVTKESYVNGKLSSYLWVYGITPTGYNVEFERYFYDEDGLCEYKLYSFMPEFQMPQKYHYWFERTDGYLSGYYSQINQAENNRLSTDLYQIRIKRKA